MYVGNVLCRMYAIAVFHLAVFPETPEAFRGPPLNPGDRDAKRSGEGVFQFLSLTKNNRVFLK